MEIKCKCIGMLSGEKWDRLLESNRRVYDAEFISPTITCCGGGNQEVKIVEPVIAGMCGRNPDNPSDRSPGIRTEQRLEIKEDGITNTLTTVQKDNMVVEPGIRVRRLTPKECWRLMGFDDDDYDRAEKVVSKSQLYKQAGNSIVVNVLMAIFKEMLP